MLLFYRSVGIDASVPIQAIMNYYENRIKSILTWALSFDMVHHTTG